MRWRSIIPRPFWTNIRSGMCCSPRRTSDLCAGARSEWKEIYSDKISVLLERVGGSSASTAGQSNKLPIERFSSKNARLSNDWIVLSPASPRRLWEPDADP